MHRFQIDSASIKNSSVLLDEKESHHAVSVLRLKTGEPVVLIDGKGRSFLGSVSGIEDGRLRVKIEPPLDSPTGTTERSSHFQITMAVSVIKPERMELLIQKACELGVHSIIPVRSERSIIKLPKERWQEKIKRWQKIASESCKQCGLLLIPEVHEVTDLKNVFSDASAYDRIIIPTLVVSTKPLYEVLKGSRVGRLLVLIGPEGDFTKKEVALAASHGAVPVTLGPLVLRTETAVIYLMSALNFFYREIASNG